MRRRPLRPALALVLAALVALTLAPASGADPVSPRTPVSPEPRAAARAAALPGCSGYTSHTVPPTTIRVYRTKLGRVDVVDFKQYVKDVLPREWIPSWDSRSLQAGAMAAKTFAWHQVLYRKSTSYVHQGVCYDVKDTVADQLYVPGSAHPRTSAAVDATWSTYMHRGGQIFLSQFCANMNCSDVRSRDTCGYATNGVRMSQWGTQDCAARLGRDHRSILRIYYGSISLGTARPAPPMSTRSISGSGDFSGDGRPDMIGYDPSRNGGQGVVYHGTTSGRLANPRVIGGSWARYNALLRLDVDGDGRQDVLARVASTGELVLLRGTGKGTLAPVSVRSTEDWNAYAQLVSPGDLTGDGRPDVLTVTPGGQVHRFTIASSGGSAVVTGKTRVALGWARFSHVVGPGDLTGDGRPDLLTVDAQTGVLRLYATTATGTPAYRAQIGTGWHRLRHVTALGDLTRDGRPDVGAVGASAPFDLRVYKGRSVVTRPVSGTPSRQSGGFGRFAGLF
ncbi:FG-GAP-like repeat-containing protein [Janibacter melonis]|nr:FG-GAP-like repeat-containing protein [Janibacter melonis]